MVRFNEFIYGHAASLCRVVVMLTAVAMLAGPFAGNVVAQTDATPSPDSGDARFGTPGEQNEPGSEELGAGRAAAMRGRWEEALDHFRAVRDGYPNGELADDASYWMAYSLEQLGRYVEAVERASEFINAYPTSPLLEDARMVRIEAAEALVRQGHADYERYLREAASPPRPPQATPSGAPSAPQAADADAELRIMALDALIGMDADAAWPVLQRLVAESDQPELRGRAVWLLSQLDTDEAFDLLVEMARSDPDPEVRANAMFWVGQSSGRSEQAIDLLVGIVNSGESGEGLEQALFGLGQSSDPRARQALETLARDASKDVELRGQALFWLGQQGSSLELLRDVALNDPDSELRGQALFGISQIDSPEASDFLLAIARSDAPVELRSNAIFWLGERHDERAIDVLIGLWDEVDDVEVRNQLLFALSQSDSERAIDHIVSVAKDAGADPEVRQQAIFWLGQSKNPRAKAALLQIIGGGEADR